MNALSIYFGLIFGLYSFKYIVALKFTVYFLFLSLFYFMQCSFHWISLANQRTDNINNIFITIYTIIKLFRISKIFGCLYCFWFVSFFCFTLFLCFFFRFFLSRTRSITLFWIGDLITATDHFTRVLNVIFRHIRHKFTARNHDDVMKSVCCLVQCTFSTKIRDELRIETM